MTPAGYAAIDGDRLARVAADPRFKSEIPRLRLPEDEKPERPNCRVDDCELPCQRRSELADSWRSVCWRHYKQGLR